MDVGPLRQQIKTAPVQSGHTKMMSCNPTRTVLTVLQPNVSGALNLAERYVPLANRIPHGQQQW
jgi:hypothetical protein